MDVNLKARFAELWQKYFGGAELPLAFWYTDAEKPIPLAKPPVGHRCIIGDLAKVRQGKALRFSAESVGCAGGKRYLGFTSEIRPEFEYFLSYGIPGKLEGERYKKSPALVNEVMTHLPAFKAPGPYIVFKRWDLLDAADAPLVVVFFATPDVLSGIFTLANYDRADPYGVIAPFGAGCATIVQYPYLEIGSKTPRAVLGMLDVSARPCVPANAMSLAVPMDRFAGMVGNMEESFLITDSWRKVKRRIASGRIG